MQDKYTKQVYHSFSALYDMDDNKYSIEEYEQHLLRHIKDVKEAALAFAYKTPGITDIKVVVGFDKDSNDYYIENTNTLQAFRPMTEFEKAYAVRSEKMRVETEEVREKGQLANLLAKYPDFPAFISKLNEVCKACGGQGTDSILYASSNFWICKECSGTGKKQ
jgi:hypothetical protein